MKFETNQKKKEDIFVVIFYSPMVCKGKSFFHSEPRRFDQLPFRLPDFSSDLPDSTNLGDFECAAVRVD